MIASASDTLRASCCLRIDGLCSCSMLASHIAFDAGYELVARGAVIAFSDDECEIANYCLAPFGGIRTKSNCHADADPQA
jgi:hypothetical protein